MSATSAFAVISTQYVVVNLEYLVPMCRAYLRLRFFVSCVWVFFFFFGWGCGGGGWWWKRHSKKDTEAGKAPMEGKVQN